MGRLILIIDDDPDFADAVTSLLVANDFEVEYAANGEIGFAKATSQKPALILLDVMMTTKTEGFDLARRLKEESRTSQIPIILVTGIRRDLNVPFSFEPDADWLPVKAVIEKPIRPDHLLKTIRDYLA